MSMLNYRAPTGEDLEMLHEAFKNHEFYCALLHLLVDDYIERGMAFDAYADATDIVMLDLWKDGFRWYVDGEYHGETDVLLRWDIVRSTKIKEYFNMVADHNHALAAKYKKVHYMCDDVKMRKRPRNS